MNKKLKKFIAISIAIAGLLILVMVADIFIFSKPHIDKNTVVMARIDFKEDIQQRDAEKITTWLYAQPGVDHVLCNPDGDCVVFTYHPIQINADELDIRLGNELAYAGQRYVPTEADMAKGCPVSPNSITYKVYSFFKNII
jgi:hypothetical protein